MSFLSLTNPVVPQIYTINNLHPSKPHVFSFHLIQKNPSFSFGVTPNSSSSSSSITNSSQNHTSFVVSYLMDSCGLSIDEAITASKKLHFKTTLNPDSILTLLQTYGFTKPHISKLITKHPSLLSSNPDNTLRPKLDFFNTKGLSGPDLARFISANPSILKCSLQNKIMPSFGVLNSICQADERVIGAVKRCSVLLRIDLSKSMMLNIELLKNVGVPHEKITWFVVSQPRTLTIRHARFAGIVGEVERMGFDPLESTFLHAVQGLTARKSTWEAKLNVFRRLGLSEDDIRSAIRKQPMCMRVSEKKMVLVMDYLLNQMGYSALVIAEFPQILTYSLEKRIIPRCRVNWILISKGLIKYPVPLTSLLIMAEKAFVEKFVIKFAKEAPELMQVPSGERARVQCRRSRSASCSTGD